MSEPQQPALADKTALITGAGRGIGRAVARAFAKAGADVAVLSRSVGELNEVAAEVRAAGRRALVIPADVADVDAPPTWVARVAAEWGRLDVLVNAAAVQRRLPVLEVTPADWDYVVGANLRGLYFLCQAAGRVMMASGQGKIVNFASTNAFRGFEGVSLYGLTKAGVVHLTKSLAVEWAPHNIQVNAIAPGWVETPMVANMAPERRRWAEAHIPQGRFGQPEEVAGLALYLASQASDYVTGQVFAIDGGFLAGNPWRSPATPA